MRSLSVLKTNYVLFSGLVHFSTHPYSQQEYFLTFCNALNEATLRPKMDNFVYENITWTVAVKKLWDHSFSLFMFKEHVVQTVWGHVMCPPWPALCIHLRAGWALSDPNRLRGQQKCPQMDCLRLGEGKRHSLGQADRRTKQGDLSCVCEQHEKFSKVTRPRPNKVKKVLCDSVK